MLSRLKYSPHWVFHVLKNANQSSRFFYNYTNRQGCQMNISQKLNSRDFSASLSVLPNREELECIDNASIRHLIQLLISEDEHKILEGFSAIITKLHNNDFLEALFVQQNGLDAIANGLESKNLKIQASSCILLGKLSTVCPSKVFDIPTITRIVRCIETAHVVVQRGAIQCLANVAIDNHSVNDLIQIGAIDVLAKLLRTGLQATQVEAAFALGTIAANSVEGQNYIRECGAIPQMTLLLSTAFDDETNEAASWGICHTVTENEDNKSLVGQSGAIGMLCQHLISKNANVRRNSVIAVYQSIENHEGNMHIMANHPNGVRSLVALLRDELEECRTYAALTLGILSGVLSDLELRCLAIAELERAIDDDMDPLFVREAQTALSLLST